MTTRPPRAMAGGSLPAARGGAATARGRRGDAEPGSAPRAFPAPSVLRRRWRRPAVLAMAAALLIIGPTRTVVGAAQSHAGRNASLLIASGPGVPKVVLQGTGRDCGPAVLATLLGWLGRSVPLAEIEAEADLREDGITLDEFARLAASRDVPGAWYEVPARDLDLAPAPFVAHRRDGGGHFVLVRNVGSRYVLVADPARGLVLEPRPRFEDLFTGRAFLLDPVPAAADGNPR